MCLRDCYHRRERGSDDLHTARRLECDAAHGNAVEVASELAFLFGNLAGIELQPHLPDKDISFHQFASELPFGRQRVWYVWRTMRKLLKTGIGRRFIPATQGRETHENLILPGFCSGDADRLAELIDSLSKSPRATQGGSEDAIRGALLRLMFEPLFGKCDQLIWFCGDV